METDPNSNTQVNPTLPLQDSANILPQVPPISSATDVPLVSEKFEKNNANTKSPSIKIYIIYFLIAILFGAFGYIIRSFLTTPMQQNNSSSLESMNNQSKLFRVQETNLDSTIEGYAPNITSDIGDVWDINFDNQGKIWVSSNETGNVVALNDKGGFIQTNMEKGSNHVPFVISFPSASDASSSGNGASTPSPLTGMIYDANGIFSGDTFTVVSEQGTISGWHNNPQSNSPLQAQIRVNNLAAGAVYKGVTYAKVPGVGWLLYVANFGQGRVDVFSSDYKPVQVQGFIDPSMPSGFAPFNIQNFNNQIYVTYAKQSIDKQNDIAGIGNGYVDIFSTKGVFTKRLISRGKLNSPWGITLTPNNFGNLSNKLLVGNFGDGYINIFDPHSGSYLGTVNDANGNPLQLDGLWSLKFSKNNEAGQSNELFFASGPSKESQGLFGTLKPISQ